MSTELLNSKLVYDLRNVINKTNIFVKDESEKEKYNLICVVMDRFDSSVNYINKHLSNPKNDDELILLMVHYCIIKDGINEVCKCLKVNIPVTNYFKEICITLFNISSNDYESDDKFFEYFRSLIFAHPFKTDRPKFLDKKEVNYSPYVIANFNLASKNNCVGALVYSNNRNTFHVVIKYDDLKNYIKDKFNVIKLIIASFDEIIKKKENEWGKHKVNRNLDCISILKDIIEILKERYIETYEIVELVEYLECKSTLKSNDTIIEKFKEEIKKLIPRLCDATDTMNYEEIDNIIHSSIDLRPKKAYPMMHYQLEKVYCYLNERDYIGDENQQWGLQQAKAFSKEFAKKYVNFDFENMSFAEIKMLVTIACIEEYKSELMLEEGD